MIEDRSRPGGDPADSIWKVVAETDDHRIVPDAVMDLVWCENQFLVAGPDTIAAVVSMSVGTETWGLRLRPGEAHALLKIPADALRNQRVPLSDFLHPPARLVDAAHTDPRSALRALARKLAAETEIDDIELRLSESLDRAARLGVPGPAMARAHNLTERSLRRTSLRLFGYSPKTLEAIHRFQRALRLAQSGASLAATAATAGYADQSHLAREVKRFAGTTLTELGLGQRA